MYVLVREDEAEQHKRELKNSIEPQIHQLLKLADEYSAEQDKLEAQLREQVCGRPFNPSLLPSLLILTTLRLPCTMYHIHLNAPNLLAHSGQKSKLTQREANRCSTGRAFAATQRPAQSREQEAGENSC